MKSRYRIVAKGWVVFDKNTLNSVHEDISFSLLVYQVGFQSKSTDIALLDDCKSVSNLQSTFTGTARGSG